MSSRLPKTRWAVAFMGSVLYAGCSPWPSLPGWGGQRRLPHSQTLQTETSAAPSLLSPGTRPILGRRADRGQEIHVVDFVFDVVRIDIPLDGVGHSRKVWSHVDELGLDPALTARLARNGLRVGTATEGAWAPIRAILDVARAQVRRDRMVAPRGAPLLIRLASLHDGETIFLHTREGTLVGKTFPAGDKLVRLDYNFHPELGGATDLQVQLEIHHDAGELTWQRQGDEIRQLPDYRRHTFTDLIAPVRLNPGEFVVIGLNHDAPGSHLVGSRFLTVERMGRRFETLLCVTPLPVQSRGFQRTRKGE